MARVSYPPAPPGYRYIFRPWKKCPHTGRVLWANAHGKRAWMMMVPI